MIRMTALVLAAAACIWAGFLKGSSYGKRIKDLETLRRIVLYLRGEIEGRKAALPEAFWKIGGKVKDPYRDFLRDISEDMRHPDGVSFEKILENNITCHLAQTRLTKEDQEELQEFGAGLGSLNREVQLVNLQQYEERLKQKTEELRVKLPERTKLCRSLGIMGGLFVLLFFW